MWVSEINIYIVSPEALLFFSLGYYVIKYSLTIKKLDAIKMYDISMLYIATIVVELFFHEKIFAIHKVNIIAGSVFLIKVTLCFIQNESVYKRLASLEKYAFFVYAVHGILLAIMTKLSVKIIPMYEAWILLQYFSVNLLGIVIFVLCGIIFKKFFPKIYGILTGGRI